MTRDSLGAERRSLGAARGFQARSAACLLAAMPWAGRGERQVPVRRGPRSAASRGPRFPSPLCGSVVGKAVQHSCCAAIRFAQLSEAVKANGGFGKDAVQPGRDDCLGWLVRQSRSCCRLRAAGKVDVRSQSVS